MLYVLSRSVGQSRAAGLASALGLGLGGVLLAIATALGLAALFTSFDWIVSLLRIVGSLYLIWLGVRMILEARTTARAAMKIEDVRQRSFAEIVWQGVWVELLNPKTVLFFALFLPQFIDVEASSENITLQLMVLGVLVPLTAIPSDVFVAWMGGTLSRLFSRESMFREVLAWVGGSVLILIAVNLYLEFI